MNFRFTAFLLFAAFNAERIAAIPQMIAHGYTSCLACHVSPTGGGVMTQYGRSLSREALSQFGEEWETDATYRAVKTPDWLLPGGDFRLLQSYVNTASFEQAKLTVMQADLEFGVIPTEDVTVVAGIGLQNAMSANFAGGSLLSRKHYVLWKAAETEYFRVGKFGLGYGIAWPDHFIFSRRDLGWDDGSELYQFEWSHIGEEWQASAAVSVGRPDAPTLFADSGLLLKALYSFQEKNQVGLNFFYGSNDRGGRVLLAPTVVLTPFDRFTVFFEVDLQKFLGGARTDAFGAVETLRLNYELTKGLHLYAMQELSKPNLSAQIPAKQAYTLGTQWFFRPHIEIAAGWRKQKTNPAQGFSDSAWMVLHLYI